MKRLSCANDGSDQVKPAWKPSGLPQLLQRRIEPHVGIVPDRLVARGGDGKADHPRRIAEALDGLDAGVGIVERQVEQRLLARILRQDLLDQPAVIGVAERDLGVDLRVHAEREHGGREHHHVVDAQRIHGALRELHLTMQPGRGRLAQLLLVHDAAGDVLVERTVGVQQTGRRAAAVAERFRDVTQHLIVDAIGDLGPERGFVDVGVDVDDQPVLELFRGRRGLGEIVAGVGARGNLLKLGDRGNGFSDIHVFHPALLNADWAEFIGSGCCPQLISTALSTQRVQILARTRRAMEAPPIAAQHGASNDAARFALRSHKKGRRT